MVTVKLSDKPCFYCRKAEKTVEASFRDRSFKGVLCIYHLWTHMMKADGKYDQVVQGHRDRAEEQ